MNTRFPWRTLTAASIMVMATGCHEANGPGMRSAGTGVSAITGGPGGTCGELSMPILAGQTLLAGTARASAETEDVVVSVVAAQDWTIAAVHIYLGSSPVPVNDAGVPAPGQFPYIKEFAPPVTSYELRVPFAALEVGCGGQLVGAIHLEMSGVDPETGESISETGWAQGPNPFDGPRWGWWFNVAICCDETPPEGEGCTYSQGYWKNHNALQPRPSQQQPWPISEDEQLCEQTWLEILRTAPRGRAWVILAHQWIAARLNVAGGASTIDEVEDAIADGGDLLSACAIAEEDRAFALVMATTLDAYNNGAIGPGHCGEDEETPASDED